MAMTEAKVLTPEELLDRAQTSEAAAFTAIRVAARLSQLLQADPARQEWMGDQLSRLPSDKLMAVSTRPMPVAEGVQVAVLAIRACAKDAALRPLVEAAIAEQAASRDMIGTGVVEFGLVVGLVLLIAKTEVSRDADGKWAFRLHPVGDSVLVELAKLGTQALKTFVG
jgi:hypothetical protein